MNSALFSLSKIAPPSDYEKVANWPNLLNNIDELFMI